jgi:REP element-mobilizing transposase RayT
MLSRMGQLQEDPSDPLKDIDLRLPLGAIRERAVRPMRVIAHHLVLTGCGHWLPNDIRGSGSVEIKKEELKSLGLIHYGRKRVQPPRSELRAFYRKAEPLLKFESIWFDHAKRQAIGEAFAPIADSYTVWACAICKNHVHFCIRAHKHSAEMMWTRLTDLGRKVIRGFTGVDPQHEVWTGAPYVVYLHTPDDVWDRIDYFNRNPIKERITPQSWPFVKRYDNWPLHCRAK